MRRQEEPVRRQVKPLGLSVVEAWPEMLAPRQWLGHPATNWLRAFQRMVKEELQWAFRRALRWPRKRSDRSAAWSAHACAELSRGLSTPSHLAQAISARGSVIATLNLLHPALWPEVALPSAAVHAGLGGPLAPTHSPAYQFRYRHSCRNRLKAFCRCPRKIFHSGSRSRRFGDFGRFAGFVLVGSVRWNRGGEGVHASPNLKP